MQHAHMLLEANSDLISGVRLRTSVTKACRYVR
jgi:hypothetical protein